MVGVRQSKATEFIDCNKFSDLIFFTDNSNLFLWDLILYFSFYTFLIIIIIIFLKLLYCVASKIHLNATRLLFITINSMEII